MWLHAVAWRAARSTCACTRSPGSKVPCSGATRDDLVGAEADHVGDGRAAAAALAFEDAGVGDLAAAGGVERRLDQLDQHARRRRPPPRRSSCRRRSSRSRRTRWQTRRCPTAPPPARAGRRRRGRRASPRAPVCAGRPSAPRSPPRRRRGRARRRSRASGRWGSRRCRAGGRRRRRRCPRRPRRGPRDQLVEPLEPLLQRAAEALLLGAHPAADRCRAAR